MIQKSEIRSQKSETKVKISKIKNLIFLFSVFCFLFSVTGCEAFVRKFTRKPKKENLPKEEMVLVPEEFKGPQMSKEELYRQHFLFWKSWHDELITSLSEGANHKKQISCIDAAIKNLMCLRVILQENQQKKLDIYINQLINLKDLITKDLYGNNISRNRLIAERIKRNILRDFSYKDIKDYLS